jgi:hypothetical protein
MATAAVKTYVVTPGQAAQLLTPEAPQLRLVQLKEKFKERQQKDSDSGYIHGHARA